MKFSIVIYSLRGGAGRVAVNLCNQFVESGHQVSIIYGHSDAVLENELRCQKEPLRKKGFLSFVCSFLKHHDFNNNFFIFDPLLGCVLTPVIKVFSEESSVAWRLLTATEYTLLQEKSKHKRILKSFLLKFGSRFCDLVIANSNGTLKSFLNVCRSFPVENASMIYNPVNLKFREDGVCLRKKLGLPAESVLISAAGRLTYQKGFDILLLAFSKIYSKLPRGSKLVVFGGGEEGESLRKLSNELGLENDVIFYGSVDYIEKWIPSSDLFVLSSRYEGFGNVIVESLALGVPVVATDCVSGPREILDNGRYGELAYVNDPESLANAILKSLSFSWDIEELVERAKCFDSKEISLIYEKKLSKVFL